MKYFSNLPLINYPQADGSTIILTNIVTRTYLTNQLAKQPLLFYEYTLNEGDLPEIVADKYYGASEQYWLIPLSNQNKIMDLQWDWPLSPLNLNLYITSKYGSVSNAVSEIHHYEKKIINTNVATGESSESIVIIDQYEYANTIIGTTIYTLPNGNQVEQVIDKTFVNSYEYEELVNEEKRTIGLINKDYTYDIENQFKVLYTS
jgi:hypothetical protein